MFEKKNIKDFFKDKKRIRNFLLSSRNREFLIFLLFLFVSACFWLLQTLKNSFETTISIPITLVNVPKDVIITQNPPANLRISIKDKGTILLSTILYKKFAPITINFSQYENSKSIVKINTAGFIKRIISQLSSSTKILAIRPDTIEYIYSIGQHKKVPVHFNGNVSASMQYYVTDTFCSPESVTVYAPPHILKHIIEAKTKFSSFSNLSDTLRRTLEMEPVQGVKFEPQHAIVTFPIDILTEKMIEVKVIGVGLPAHKLLRFFPSKVQVSFLVGLHRFKYIHDSDFTIEVSYDQVVKNNTSKCHLELKTRPYGINHVRIIPTDIDYLIEERK